MVEIAMSDVLSIISALQAAEYERPGDASDASHGISRMITAAIKAAVREEEKE